MTLFGRTIVSAPVYWIGDDKIDDCERCSLASVVVRGGFFRNRILRAAADPVVAPAFEIGISKRDIVILCHFVESMARNYRIAFSLLLILLFACTLYVGDATNWDLGSVLLVWICFWPVASGISYFRQRQFTDLKYSYSKSSNARSTAISSCSIGRADLSCVGSSNQNVLLYRDFSPFEFAGIRNSGWSFVVDITKQLNSTANSNIERLQTAALESELSKALSGQFQTMTRDILVMHGYDHAILPSEVRPQYCDSDEMEAVQDPNFPYDREAILLRQGAVPALAPRVHLSQAEIGDILERHPDIARRYLWFTVDKWNNQLVISNFIRFKVDQRTLYVEYERRVLLPIPDPIGYMSDPSEHSFSTDLTMSLVGGVIDVISQPILLVFNQQVTIGKKLAEYYRHVKYRQINCGAEPSFRQMINSDSYTHYFQRMEVERIGKEINTIIFETIARVLEDCGIDSGDLRNKGTIIYNSGLLVQSGDVSAQALAVGEGSNAKTGVFMTQPSEAPRRAAGGG
jgi:hypothetical protein